MDNILWGYLSKKCKTPISSITKEKITSHLTNLNVDTKIIKNLNELINVFELLRFSPIKEQKEELKNVLQNFKNIINNIK